MSGAGISSHSSPDRVYTPQSPFLQPWQDNYLNHGTPADQIHPEASSLSLYEQVVIGSAHLSNPSHFVTTSTGVVSSSNLVAPSPTVPMGFGLPTPSSTYVAELSLPFDTGVRAIQPPPNLQAVHQAQQAVPLAYLSAGNDLPLSVGEDAVFLLENQDESSSSYPMLPPQDAAAPSRRFTRPGKRRRDDAIDVTPLGNEAACQPLFSSAEIPPDFYDGGDGVRTPPTDDVSGPPSSSRRTKALSTRKDKATAEPKPKRQPKGKSKGKSSTPNGFGSPAPAVGPSDFHGSSEGSRKRTQGLYLGPATSISHWLQSVYRNRPGGPSCSSPSSEGNASTSQGKGMTKSSAATAHLPRIHVNRLNICVFCGESTQTMTRHLETSPLHGGGWAALAASGGALPSGKRLIEAVFLMLFATAKKDHGEPWCEQELTARDKFIAEWSNVDFSEEGNTAVEEAATPEALKGRFLQWCRRLSKTRFCDRCKTEFSRPDSYARHSKTCRLRLEPSRKGEQPSPSASSTTVLASSSTTETSTPSTSWVPSSSESPWSTSEFSDSGQLVDAALPSPKRQRRS